jgi:EmrB/QacA subfamily drug resistance transporter
MPRIASSLHGFDRYAWVVTAYLLASTTMIPLVGKLSDRFGRKGFLVLGTVLFLLGSLLSGALQTMDQLILFRALQGLGAGIGISLVVTVIGDIFPPQERAKWSGIVGGVYGISSLIGPTLGGWLTEHGPLLGNLVTAATRWRWVFYINLPVGVIALVALSIFLPPNISIRTNRYRGWMAVRRIDFVGAVLAAAATICLLLGLTWGSDGSYAWTPLQVMSILAAACILYLCFFVTERFVAEPILPLNLLRNQVFTAGSLLSLLQGMILLGLVISLPFFLQGVLGVSATSSGLLMTPFTLSSVVGAMIAGGTIARTKRYQLITIIGMLILTIGAFFGASGTVSLTSFAYDGVVNDTLWAVDDTSVGLINLDRGTGTANVQVVANLAVRGTGGIILRVNYTVFVRTTSGAIVVSLPPPVG